MKNTFLLCALIFILPFNSATAQNIETHKITQTSQLQNKEYAKKIEDFYETGNNGYLNGQASTKIYYKTFIQEKGEKGAVMISSGRTEAAIKYKEVIYDLYQNGYSVYIHDHRGQGLSGRMTEDPHMGHIDNFQYYIDDMKLFYDQIVNVQKHKMNFLLCHSLGGAIGMSYLEQYPKDFTKASFCSPMLGFAGYICPLAKVLSGKNPKYAPGQGPYNENKKFEGNDVSGSEVRFERKLAATKALPETKLGGVSVQWLERSCKTMKMIFRHIDNIQTPLIIFTAENETVVDADAHYNFIKQAKKKGKECELIEVKNARHEILMEKDDQRNLIMHKTLSFFEE